MKSSTHVAFLRSTYKFMPCMNAAHTSQEIPIYTWEGFGVFIVVSSGLSKMLLNNYTGDSFHSAAGPFMRVVLIAFSAKDASSSTVLCVVWLWDRLAIFPCFPREVDLLLSNASKRALFSALYSAQRMVLTASVALGVLNEFFRSLFTIFFVYRRG